MGNCVSLSLDRCVDTASQWIVEKVGYTHNLEKNLDDLKPAMELLKAKQDDLSRKLKSEEDRGFQALTEFKIWFDRVDAIEKTVEDLLDNRDVELQRLFLCGFCSKSLISSYRYGKSVFLMLREVEKLKSEDFPVIAVKAQTHEVQERPHETTIVGQETMLDKAWNHLKEEGVGIMGMYGMGGVGKTTLLTQINNKLREESCEFDYVIWIVVSKELHVEKIQHEITKQVGVDQHEEWKHRDNTERGIYLFNFLRKKKFILFLDDIWEKVDLVKIGVPDPRKQKGCKVVFTTRSFDVCSHMGVEEPMEIKCLEDEVAFDLFRKKVGEITLGSDPGIPKLARIVAKKCRGLPLALSVIGETMSCKRTIQEWQDAIFELESHEVKFADMEDKILVLLKFSYDSLKEEQAKACLLYCALFPEDAKIYKETLIDYWMCDGVIAIDDGCGGIEKAEKKGYTIIGGLVRASLLMDPGDEDGKGVVCMHDVIREMAIWIASGIEKEAFVVHANIGLYNIPKIKNWNAVRNMSLMCNRIGHLDDRHVCSELTTLLLQWGSLEIISSEFFKSMPRLSVLDLSGNRYLKDLPNEMSELVSLQYLNLSYTGIRHLAKDLLQGLRKLIHLDLEYTRYLRSIAGMSSVQNLKVLKLFGSRWNFDSIEELEALEHLEILTVSLYDSTTYTTHKERFMKSHKLMSCTQVLWIRHIKETFGISLQGTMNKLREFNIRNGTVSDIKIGKKDSFLNLVKVHVDYLKGLKDLTFLIFVPRLRILEVGSSKHLEDIINKEKACEVEDSRIVPFQELSEIHFSDLRQLKSIYWSPLPFPNLKVMKIMECPNLKKLPLDSKCGKQDELILTYSEEEWLANVEWKDEDTKRRFLSSCQWTPCVHSYEPFYHSGYDYEDDDAFRYRSTDRKLLLNSR